MRRKFLSVLLAMAMVLTMVPVTALAAGLDVSFATGEGINEGITANAIPYGTGNVTFSIAATSDGAVTGLKATVEGESGFTPVSVPDTATDAAVTFDMDVSDLDVGDYTVKVADDSDTNSGTVTIKIVAAEVSYTHTGTSVEVGDSYPVKSVEDAAEAEGVGASKVKGTLSWFTDSARTTETKADDTFSTEGKTTLYWTFAPVASATNYKATNGATEFTVAAADPGPTVTEITDAGEITIEAPATGGTPATGITKLPDDADYTAALTTPITWDKQDTLVSGKFAADTEYTATVKLTAKANYKFTTSTAVKVKGVADASITDKSVDNTNAQNTLTFKVKFPATEAASAQPIASVSVSGVTAPATGNTPVAKEALTAGAATYTVKDISWGTDLNAGKFKSNTAYTATIVLEAEEGNKFTDSTTLPAANTFVAGATVTKGTVTDTELTFTVTFPKTEVTIAVAADLTGSAIKFGQTLADSTLSGGKVTAQDTGAEIAGTWTWDLPNTKPSGAGATTGAVTFAPRDASIKISNTSALKKSDVSVTVNVADYTYTVKNAQTLNKDNLGFDKLTAPAAGVSNVDGSDVAGTLQWFASDDTSKDIPLDATFWNDKSGEASVALAWKFTPTTAANYEAAKEGTVTVTISSKDVLTLEFAKEITNVTYGGSAPANALTIEVNGSAPGTTITPVFACSPVGSVTIGEDGAVTAINKAGDVTITATVANTNTYDPAGDITASYTLKVAKAPLTITAADKSMVQNTTKPELTYTVSGLVNGDEEADTIKSVTVTCAADGKTAGTFDIVPSGATFETDKDNYTVTYVNGTLTVTEAPAGDTVTPPTISASGSTVTITVPAGTTVYYTTNGSDPTTSSARYDAPFTVPSSCTVKAIAVKTDDPTKKSTVTSYDVTVGGGGGGSHSSGGGGGSTSSTVTVPVSGDDHSVEVSAKVSGSTATIDKIDGLDKVLDSDADTGVVEIDLTALKKDIDTVSISASSIEDIAKAAADSDNDVDGLAVKLDSGTVEFDADALEAIVDQATSSSIQLVLEKTNSSDLNSSQRDAVKDMDIHGHFDLTLTGGKVITDFKGGRVSVRIPFTVPSGKDAANFVVIYVANDGTVEEMRTSCSGGYISFTTDHFSKYLIAYKDSEPVEPVETPETADCDGGANCPAGRFTDVNTDLWYHKAIDYVLTNGLMSGVGDGTFAPNANLSRAMLAQILYNQEGRPAASADSVFDDVAAGMWYTNAIAWAAENGVVSGLGDGKFGPNNNITREQLAVMLYRYAGSPSAAGGGSLDRFADADKASDYAKDALVWATGMGIMSGKGGGMLDPQGQATRAEVAQMLYNYLNK